MKFCRKIFLALFAFIFFSCTTTSRIPKQDFVVPPDFEEPVEEKKDYLKIAFAGDIMCHTENARGNFQNIYADVKDLTLDTDFTFANFECPVDDTKEYTSYPAFNCHSEYVEEAVNAGFNLFSLANNHTNDYYLGGINSTRNFFESLEEKSKLNDRKIYACGIKKTSGAELTYRVFEKDEWKILFASVTQLLNRPQYSSYIDYYPMNKKSCEKLLEEIKMLRAENECDVFILSLHTSEEEYVLSVAESHKNFFDEIINSCVDVLVVNHPHVVRPFKLIKDDDEKIRKIIFYAQGNFISGQRRNPQFNAPETLRDYTGDGLISTVVFKKSDNGIFIESLKNNLVTTFITSDDFYELKKLDDDFIEKVKNTKWEFYLKERKKLMEKIICQ